MCPLKLSESLLSKVAIRLLMMIEKPEKFPKKTYYASNLLYKTQTAKNHTTYC